MPARAPINPFRPTQVDRYVLRQLLVALVAATGALVALIWLTQSIRFVELVVNHGLSLRVFLELTGLLIPNFVAVILPITTFIVVLFVYQRLAGDRELTVMRAAGLSPLTLARPALALAGIAMAACFALNLYLVPASLSAFRQFQFEIRNRVAAFLLQEGVFTPVSDQLTVYVRARDPDGTLHGIVVDDNRDTASHATILARSGQLISSEGAPRVLLLDGSRQELDRQTGRLNVLTFARNTIELSQGGKAEEQRFRDPTEMSLDELLRPPASMPEHERPKLLIEAHRRLSGPFSAASFALVGLVSTLMGGFRRYGNLLRPLAAVAVVVALLAGSLTIANLAQRNPALLPLVWVEAIGPGLVCFWLLAGPQLNLMPAALQARLGA